MALSESDKRETQVIKAILAIPRYPRYTTIVATTQHPVKQQSDQYTVLISISPCVLIQHGVV